MDQDLQDTFDKLDGLANRYTNEKDKENCVVLINGKRFRLRSNVVVFENKGKALVALRNLAWRYVRWHSNIAGSFDAAFDKWVEKRVIFVSPEEYYRFKRKMREG